MTEDPRDLERRIAEQFSGRRERSDVWRGFDAFLDTDAFLNLGYSPRYSSHLLGSPQDRLAARVLEELSRARSAVAGTERDLALAGTDRAPASPGARLLDVGCGRGGPTRRIAAASEYDVVGIDLVRHNVAMARREMGTSQRGGSDGSAPAFLVGDATQLPFADRSFAACVAIDSLVYVPAVSEAFAEIARVLAEGGVGAVSDLVVDPDADASDGTLGRFARAWDMPRLRRRDEYRSAIDATRLRTCGTIDLTDNSVGRFRKWSRLYLALAEGPAGGALAAGLRRGGLDPEVVTEQVRAAHEALPALRHVLVTFER
ncbi:MAG: class I SAM-dependent methyltransferase [Haloferacaceae archaeon]